MRAAVSIERLSKRYILGERRAGSLRELLGALPRRALMARRRPPASERELWALRDLDLEVADGEVLGLVGANGAGKSTLLKILSRITDPTSGRARIRGRVASLLEVGTGFHPELTGRENIFLNGAIIGMRRAEIAERFDEIAAFAGIDRFLDTPVKRYSSGMYMRLAFSVAAHLVSEILLVDEVLAVGDAAFQAKCLGRMESLRQEGRTVIFVSHNMGAVRRLCGRAVWLDRGTVVECGDPERVIDAYLSSSVDRGTAWAPPPAIGRAFEYHRVSIEHDGREPGAPELDRHRALSIRLDYSVHRDLPPGRLSLRLSNASGVVVLTSCDTDASPSLDRVWTKGRFRVRVPIPAEALAPSRYLLTISEPREDGTHVLNENVLAFRLSDDGSPSIRDSREGILVPILKWESEALEEHP